MLHVSMKILVRIGRRLRVYAHKMVKMVNKLDENLRDKDKRIL